jgi:hypothetical protein
MRCKTCHYSQANLTEHRCPECGNPFDPNDPSTFHVPLSPNRLLMLILLFLTVAIFIGLWITRLFPLDSDWALIVQIIGSGIEALVLTLVCWIPLCVIVLLTMRRPLRRRT